MKNGYCNYNLKKIVVIGESITAGGSASEKGKSWVARLNGLLNEFSPGIQIINMGMGANILTKESQGYKYASHPTADERIYRDVINLMPDMVIISYGMNDMRCGTDINVFGRVLGELVDLIKKECNSIIVLLNIYYMKGYGAYGKKWGYGNSDLQYKFNSVIKLVAKNHECLYADIFDAQKETDWLLDKDEIHANDLGHLIIANKVFEAIATNCSFLSNIAYERAAKMEAWRDESVLVDEDNRKQYIELLFDSKKKR